MRALVSVHDKTGLEDFAQRLVTAGWEIVSSGGTATALESAGLPVTRVSDITGAPEILGGRVKTLHPVIHGGILARRPTDDAELEREGIDRFDLVVCNLYPFVDTLASGVGDDALVEMIDIGGSAMIRAAAKNHHRVGVVVSPGQYEMVADAIESDRLGDGMRRQLAAEAFFLTASYDAAVAGWLGDHLVVPLRRISSLRYGENPHQAAAIYVEDGASPWWLRATVLQGKEMSFNNWADAEAAWRLCLRLEPVAAVVVKHTVACGAATAATVGEAFEGAWDGDVLAAFGGVVALSEEIDETTAELLAERFVEVVVTPSVASEAVAVLSRRPGMRVVTAPAPGEGPDFRRVDGGFLVQQPDLVTEEGWDVVSSRAPTQEEQESLRIAWHVAAHARSNAVALVRNRQAVGIGSGDQSRVGASERAVAKAGERSAGAVAASDAFFPFRDGLDTLARAGVTAVLAPGGSRNDAEVIAAADEHGIALLFAPERHFRH